MNLVWFRNDLRIADNHSLKQAATSKEKVLAVYFFDPKHYTTDRFGFKKTEKFRAKFLIETVTELKKSLEAINVTLLVFHTAPEEKLPQLLNEYDIKKVYLQEEWTFEERLVFEGVQKNTPSNVEFITSYDQFLIHPQDLPYANFDKIPQVFTQWRKKCEKQASVRECISIEPFSSENLIDTKTSIPTLEDLGLQSFEQDDRTAFPFQGGESQALKRIQYYFWETKNLARYKKTRNGLMGKDYSSKLSAWLANGSISPRTIYWEVKKFEKEETKNDSTYWLNLEKAQTVCIDGLDGYALPQILNRFSYAKPDEDVRSLSDLGS